MKPRLLLWLLCCLLNSAALAESKNAALTLQQLITLKEVSQARMSPDGQKVAFLVNVPRQPATEKAGPDYQELYIVDRHGKVRPFMTGKHRIKQLQWSSNGKQLWLLVKRAYEASFAVYVFNISGGEAHKIVSRSGNILGFSLNDDSNKLLFWHPKYPDDSTLHYQRQGFSAIVEEEQPLNSQLWLMDFNGNDSSPSPIPFNQHVMHASFIKDDEILLKSAPDYRVDSQVMRAGLSVINTAGEVQYKMAYTGKIGHAKASPDGKTIAFLGSADAASPDHGVLMVAHRNKRTPNVLLNNVDAFVTDFAFLSAQQIVFTADQGTSSMLGRKRVNSPGPGFRTIIKNKLIFRAVDSQSTGKSAAVIAHHPHHPPELFWLKGDTLIRMSDSNPQLRDRILPRQESIDFTSFDGLSLQGVLVSPAQLPEDMAAPLIVFVHGGPESHISNGWLGSYSHPVHALTAKGFRCFFPNYRGSSGRGSEFLKLGQLDYAGAEFDDLLAARQFLVKKGLALTDKVGISGVSYGGYATAWAATRYSEHFQAAVMLSGISNNISKFGTTDIPSEMIQTHALKMPWENWEFLLKRSPIYYSELHQTPLLIAHGLKDTRVHVSQSMELYRHLKMRAQAPVRFVTYPEQGHGHKESHSQLDYALRLTRWFEHFLLNEQKRLPEPTISYPSRESIR